MCLIIHKPKEARIDLDLLHSASQYNPHGYGLMALSSPHRIHIVRNQQTKFDELRSAYAHFSKHECVIHLRLRTKGHVNHSNTHPFRLTNKLYMAHNGTLDINCRIPGRSDSWHKAYDLLSPLLQRDPKLIHDRHFQHYLAHRIGSQNRMVFMDAERQKTVIINQSLGKEYQGVWLSNTRWFDAARFGLPNIRADQGESEVNTASKLTGFKERLVSNFNPSGFLAS